MDIRLLIPRTRRAIQGPTGAGLLVLSDAQVRDVVADAIAEAMWYAPSWGKTLTVTAFDTNDLPLEYDVAPDLTLPEQTVVTAQAALDVFFHEFKDKKTAETIANEAQSWSWQKSASVLQAQFQALIEARDRALDMVGAGGANFVAFASFLAARDYEISTIVEPFTLEAGAVVGALGIGGRYSGYTDWRFE